MAVVCSWRSLLTLALASTTPLAALATESGAGHYLPGSAATLIDLAPTKPGWVAEGMYLHYSGDASASRPFPIAGNAVADLEVESDAFLLGGLYTFEVPALRAHYSVGAFLPLVVIDVKGEVDTPLGSVSRRDLETGLGDMTLIPLMLGWKTGRWQWDAMLPISAPTGDYDVGHLANPGLNYWTFDPTLGVAYNNEKIGFNAAFHEGITLNTKNTDTNYQSGAMLHLDASVQQLLPAGPGYVGIGAEGFYLQQVTGDSGSGAQFGSFRGLTAGVGPVLTYVLPWNEDTLVAELRWLPELAVERRLKGDYVWLKIAFQF
jgi:hypothetical protein